MALEGALETALRRSRAATSAALAAASSLELEGEGAAATHAAAGLAEAHRGVQSA
jgi:hypothetical protein